MLAKIEPVFAGFHFVLSGKTENRYRYASSFILTGQSHQPQIPYCK